MYVMAELVLPLCIMSFVERIQNIFLHNNESTSFCVGNNQSRAVGTDLYRTFWIPESGVKNAVRACNVAFRLQWLVCSVVVSSGRRLASPVFRLYTCEHKDYGSCLVFSTFAFSFTCFYHVFCILHQSLLCILSVSFFYIILFYFLVFSIFHFFSIWLPLLSKTTFWKTHRF